MVLDQTACPREQLNGCCCECHWQPRWPSEQDLKGGHKEVCDPLGGDPVASSSEQSVVSNPDAFPLRDEIGPALRSVVDQGGLWHVVQVSSFSSELSLERGLIHNGVRIDWMYGRPKCDHFAELWPMASDAIKQHPLEMHDSIDHAPWWIRWAWSSSSHPNLGILQGGEQTAECAVVWDDVTADEHDGVCGRWDGCKEPIDGTRLSATVRFDDRPNLRMGGGPRLCNLVGSVGTAAGHNADPSLLGLLHKAPQEGPYIGRLVVRHDADFDPSHTQEIACCMAQNRQPATQRLRMVLVVVHLVLGLWFLERGLFNEDEGWYLYAARQVDAGLMPVRDFVFYQGPVYPRVMAGLLDAGQGMIISARWLSWFMLTLALGVTVLAGARSSGPRGGLLALTVMATQPLLISTAVLAKPYALCLLLLSGGLLLLAARDRLRVFMGFVLLGVSVGARLTLAVPFAVLVVSHLRGRGVSALLGAGLGLTLSMSPLVGVPVDDLYSQLIGAHVGHQPTLVQRGAWFGWQIGLLAFWLLALLPGRPSSIPGLRLAAGLGVMIHAWPGALHVEHTMVLAPLFAVAFADRWGTSWSARQLVMAGVAMVVSVVVGAQFVHLDTQTRTMQQVTDLGRWVADRTTEDRPLFTPHLGIAVEADRDVVRGFEMGRFAVGKLDLSGERGESLRGRLGGVILVTEDIEDGGQGGTLSWARTEFSESRIEEPYGQFGQRLWLFVPGEDTLWAQ